MTNIVWVLDAMHIICTVFDGCASYNDRPYGIQMSDCRLEPSPIRHYNMNWHIFFVRIAISNDIFMSVFNLGAFVGT